MDSFLSLHGWMYEHLWCLAFMAVLSSFNLSGVSGHCSELRNE